LAVRADTCLDHGVGRAERPHVKSVLPPVPGFAFAAEPSAGDRQYVGRRVRLAFGLANETIEDAGKGVRHQNTILKLRFSLGTIGAPRVPLRILKKPIARMPGAIRTAVAGSQARRSSLPNSSNKSQNVTLSNETWNVRLAPSHSPGIST